MRAFSPRTAALAFASCIAVAAPAAASELSTVLTEAGVDPARAALLVVRLEDGERWTAGGNRIETRFSPASTSKVPHTLIALESGLAKGPEEPFKWDGVKRWLAFWNQDQTLATAYARSALWVYQDITARLGHAAMKDWIARFDYGNRDVGSEADLTTYWLGEPLAISAAEQIDFLGRLATRKLPLSARTYEMAEQIMQADAGEGWTLYAKTGLHAGKPDVDIGWYVGWLKNTQGDSAGTYLFAFNMDLVDRKTELKKRIAVPRAALAKIGALPRE